MMRDGVSRPLEFCRGEEKRGHSFVEPHPFLSTDLPYRPLKIFANPAPSVPTQLPVGGSL